MPVYAAHLRDIIKKGIKSSKDYDKPLSGFKIAVDAGNGSGGFLATDVLAKLGADTSGELPTFATRNKFLAGTLLDFFTEMLRHDSRFKKH